MEKSNFNKAFWEWFGDSKVVDANGEPLVVYHGTNLNFKKFKANIFGQSLFYFSKDKKYALKHAKQLLQQSQPIILECYLSANKILDATQFGVNKITKFQLEQFLTNNGVMVSEGIKGNSRLWDVLKDVMFWEVLRYDNENQLEIAVKNAGFNGMSFYEINKYGNTAISYVVFSPNQIKSVNNDGTWDSGDDSILSGVNVNIQKIYDNTSKYKSKVKVLANIVEIEVNATKPSSKKEVWEMTFDEFKNSNIPSIRLKKYNYNKFAEKFTQDDYEVAYNITKDKQYYIHHDKNTMYQKSKESKVGVHRVIIENAILDGKNVPKEVKYEYPKFLNLKSAKEFNEERELSRIINKISDQIKEVVGERPNHHYLYSLSTFVKSNLSAGEITIFFGEEVKDGRGSYFNTDRPLRLKNKVLGTDDYKISVEVIEFVESSKQESDYNDYIDYEYKLRAKRIKD